MMLMVVMTAVIQEQRNLLMKVRGQGGSVRMMVTRVLVVMVTGMMVVGLGLVVVRGRWMTLVMWLCRIVVVVVDIII